MEKDQRREGARFCLNFFLCIFDAPVWVFPDAALLIIIGLVGGDTFSVPLTPFRHRLFHHTGLVKWHPFMGMFWFSGISGQLGCVP